MALKKIGFHTSKRNLRTFIIIEGLHFVIALQKNNYIYYNLQDQLSFIILRASLCGASVLISAHGMSNNRNMVLILKLEVAW